MDQPNVYNLPAAPKLPARNIMPGLLASPATAALLVGATALAFLAGRAGRAGKRALIRPGLKHSPKCWSGPASAPRSRRNTLDGHAPAGQRKPGQLTPPRRLLRQAGHQEAGMEVVRPRVLLPGGVAGGAYIVAAVVDMCGKEEDRALVRAGRYLSRLSRRARSC